ncbi:MAG: cyclodeaminase/cyclohydrolase family protein [Candidatus Omnitrophica bacterium]|nr:cyclodeaminase/cyclohydrolase family protein [Candidatus Omnitrophota bacterium]
MYKDESLTKFLDDTAAKMPAPGGGASAALTAAMGAALLSMVINFTLGKPKYVAFETELKASLEKAEQLRAEFLRLVDLDVTAYASKDLRNALDVPFMVCRLCEKAIELCPPLVKKGNVNLISDVAVAAILLESAFAAALCNVEINLKALGEKSFTKAVHKELRAKEKVTKKIRAKTEAQVGKIIRG